MLAPAPSLAGFDIAGPGAVSVDDPPGVRTIEFEVVASGTIVDLDVSLRVDANYADQLQIAIAKDGVSVDLYSGAGDTPGAEIDARFDDEAAAGPPPAKGSVLGSFQPAGSLSAFDGLELAGSWRITIADPVRTGDDTELTGYALSATVEQSVALAGSSQPDVDGATPGVTSELDGDVLLVESFGRVRGPIDRGAAAVVDVRQAGTIADLDVALEVPGPYADNLDVSLRHLGTQVKLYGFDGAEIPESFIEATFDDEALDDWPTVGSVTGRVRPSPDALSAFDGMPIEGRWELLFEDTTCCRDDTRLAGFHLRGVLAGGGGRVEVSGGSAAGVDRAPPGSMHTLQASGPGTISDLDVYVGLSAPFADELDLVLSHAGVSARLIDAVGSTPSAVVDAVLDDEAQAPLPGSGSVQGRFRPSPDALTTFDGTLFEGSWTLALVDEIGAGDDTALLDWTLVAALPEPGSAAALLAALLTLAALRRSALASRPPR